MALAAGGPGLTGPVETIGIGTLGKKGASAMKHVTVYHEAGRFGGWPANQGIWSWGNEIVVGFVSGGFQASQNRHAIDASRPEEEWQARSRDGGETWQIEKPANIVPARYGGPTPVECPGGIPFTHPHFAMRLLKADGAGGGRLFYSTDGCRTWPGPFILPLFGQTRIDPRTDYLVDGEHECLLFLTAAKSDGREGRVFCARTTDGGKTWQHVAWLGPEPKGFAIMPSSVRLSPKRILTAVRCKEGAEHWIDAYLSEDNGETWRLLNRPVPSTGGNVGNPPSMIRLRDGRLCLTYGYRSEPFGIRARLSGDEGLTWSEERILRADGGNWDLGYPRTVQRMDGKVVTIYYINERWDQERYIAATIWEA
jgi:hypothetical protein